ncbi:MAG: hypothetical protein VX549_14235 [Pseudomonadota bacterium]|nr:hypothetical protein [Pseudomonadota bacterium]
MTKLITGIALLVSIVLFLLSDSKLADAHRDDLELHIALPIANGGSQLVQIDATRGQPITATNMNDGSLERRLDANAYRIEGHWASEHELSLDIYVATTTTYKDRPGSVKWAPSVELVRHTLAVQPKESAHASIPQRPAPGGIPQALLVQYEQTPRS